MFGIQAAYSTCTRKHEHISDILFFSVNLIIRKISGDAYERVCSFPVGFDEVSWKELNKQRPKTKQKNNPQIIKTL